MRLSVLDPATLQMYFRGGHAFRDELYRASLSTVDSDRSRVSGGSLLSSIPSQPDSRHISLESANSAATGWSISTPYFQAPGRDFGMESVGNRSAAMSGGHDSRYAAQGVPHGLQGPFDLHNGTAPTRIFGDPSSAVSHGMSSAGHQGRDSLLPTYMSQPSLFPPDRGLQASPAGLPAARPRGQKGPKAFWCPEPECGTGYSRPHDLRRHVVSVHIIWQCSLCPKTKTGPAAEKEMTTHYESKHGPMVPHAYAVADRQYFGCPFCYERLKSISQYLDHMVSQHRNIRVSPPKRESSRLFGLLLDDDALTEALDQGARDGDVQWAGIERQPANTRILINDLESGWPYATEIGRARFVQKWLGYLDSPVTISAQGSFMDLS
ncbi:hypothetical protein LTR17_002053 [Elasticomyces elasticus]|nr:hypothetical protein LTR17_002053 [Elasticomyces elasticus]